MCIKEQFSYTIQSIRKITVPSLTITISVFLALLLESGCSSPEAFVDADVMPATVSTPVSADLNENCSLGFCFAVIENRTEIEPWRIIHVCLKKTDFSLDNIKLVAKSLSNKYAEPNQLIIEIATDSKFFSQANTGETYYQNMAHYARHNGKVELSYTQTVPTHFLTKVDVSDLY